MTGGRVCKEGGRGMKGRRVVMGRGFVVGVRGGGGEWVVRDGGNVGERMIKMWENMGDR